MPGRATSRRSTDFKEIIAKVVSKVPDAQVMSDLDATVAWAKSAGQGDTAKLGITGFCWGGRIVWLYSAHNPRAQGRRGLVRPAGVGRADELHPKYPVDVAGALKAPVLGLYGGADKGIPPEHVEKMPRRSKKADKPAEIVVYPDTPHAFFADYRESYRPEQAADGWKRMLEWFRKNGVA